MKNIKRSKVVHLLGKQLDKRDNLEVNNNYIFTTLFLGAVIVVINQMAMNTALPSMIESIDVSPSLGQWIVSGFSLMKGIMVPITAFAMTKYRTRNLFNLMLGLFSFGSFVTAIGFNFLTVVIGTIIQGIASGMILPIMQTVLLTLIPVDERGSALGVMSGVIGVGMALGPFVGGSIVDLFTWHVLFYLWGVITLILIPLTWLILPDVLPNSNLQIQWCSVRDSLIGFGLLLYSISLFGSSGLRSPLAYISLVIALFFIFKFIRFNWESKKPLLNIRLLRNRKYTIAVIVATLALMIINGVSTVLPIYIQTIRGFGARITGLILLPAGIIKTVLAPISGRLFDKLGIAKIGIIGGVSLALGAVMLATVSENTSLFLVMIYCAFIYAGFGIFNIPVTTLGMNEIPKEEMGHATSVRQTFRQISSSFSISILFIAMSLITGFTSIYSVNELTSQKATAINLGGVRAGLIFIVIFALTALALIFVLKDYETKDQ